MGYVDRSIVSGEQVLYKARITWLIFVPGVAVLIIGIYLFDLDKEGGVGMIGAIAIFLAILSLIKAFIAWVSTELAVTSKRVIAKVGLISRKTIELNHTKVESFNIDQSIFGRLFNFGTVIVNGTGGSKTPIPSVDSPLEFRRNAIETIDVSQCRPNH